MFDLPNGVHERDNKLSASFPPRMPDAMDEERPDLPELPNNNSDYHLKRDYQKLETYYALKAFFISLLCASYLMYIVGD